MNDLTCKILENRLERYEWKENFIGLWSHDLFDYCIDTNSDVIVARDLDGYRIEDFDMFNVTESTPIKAARFVDYLNNSSTAINYRSDLPF